MLNRKRAYRESTLGAATAGEGVIESSFTVNSTEVQPQCAFQELIVRGP